MITTSSAASLPDGGAKLHSRLASLHQELASLGGTGRMAFKHRLNVLWSDHPHLLGRLAPHGGDKRQTAQLHVCAAFMDAQ